MLMTARTIEIRIDDRARLMSAALSVTSWPEIEQTRQRHRAHVHARNTTKYLLPYANHPAVRTLQALLDQNTPLEAIFAYALSLSWPGLKLAEPPAWAPSHWYDQLADFYDRTALDDWWADEDDMWRRALDEMAKTVADTDVYTFFQPFVGEISERFVLTPNICYPTDSEVGARLDSELVCIMPPRIAWGDNEPWPFDDDAGHLFRGALAEYGRLLMVAYLRQNTADLAPLAATPLPVSDEFRATHPTWSDQFTSLFVAGAVAIFLEQRVGPKEARAYMLMENKVHGMSILPGVVSVLKRYLSEQAEGRYQELSDYLPSFARHLRVAKRVVSL